MINEATGLPHREVGIILLDDQHSFAQIPEAGVNNLDQFPGAAQWQDQPVQIRRYTMQKKVKKKGGKKGRV